MSAEEIKLCGLCLQLHENEPAESWCPECNQFLCKRCTKYHNISMTSKNHEVIGMSNYFKIPKELLVSNTMCKEHDMQLELYCKKHETPCCSSCLKKYHTVCSDDDVIKFGDAVKGIKSSAKFGMMDSSLSAICKDIEQILSYSSKSIKQLDDQTNSCLTKLRETRKQINAHFDQLEKGLVDQIQTKQSKSKAKMTKLASELISKQQITSQLSKDLKDLHAFSTNIQTYFGLNVIEKKLNYEETFLTTLIDSKSLSRRSIRIDFSSINNLLQATKTIGELVVEDTPFNERLCAVKAKQAQLLVNKSKSIHDFKFRLKQKVNLKSKIKGSLDGCVIKPSGDLLLLSFDSKQLYTCKGDGSDFFSIATFDETPIDLDFDPITNTVMVGCNGAEASYVVNLSNNKVDTRKIGCSGISINKGKVYGTDPDESKIICSPLNKPDKVYSELTDLNEMYYLSVTDNAILCTNSNNNEVISYNHKGQRQWSFKHYDLKYPLGISSSPVGFSFITCHKSINIWLISPDGTEGRIVAQQSDGVENPRCVHFNSDRKELVFANEYSAEVFVYDVEW